ncbi:unnamed protein product [Rotaria sp. Silwood2]|nr:unnamed protein product [Rotaria sp. Silwood2]CAF2720769.1 unnamed protein product [Rotaria sp. Silwood2]CAF2969339.1 unnamed protein product [Rotaria sp. Silwood2]CAF3106798.1 unnamed protein product [Rotaria sp. Silwood2]CAF3910742.1 unnamed protein product [Rotaria sp. Silwood2]
MLILKNNRFCFFSPSELAREKNFKNQKNKGHSVADTETNKGLSLQERQLRDAARMREKQQLAEQKKATGDNNASDGSGAAASAR